MPLFVSDCLCVDGCIGKLNAQAECTESCHCGRQRGSLGVRSETKFKKRWQSRWDKDLLPSAERFVFPADFQEWRAVCVLNLVFSPAHFVYGLGLLQYIEL